MWNYCGMIRNKKGLEKGLSLVRDLKDEFWKDLNVPGTYKELNMELEKAGRVADYLDFAQLLITDALRRNESCGAHFREEYQTSEGEALRNDEEYAYVAAWEYAGEDKEPVLHREYLKYEEVEPKVRSYK